MTKIAPHHWLYATLLVAFGSVIGYYVVQNERAAIRVQDDAAQTMRDLPKTITGALDTETGWAIGALHFEGDATRKLLSGQISGLRKDVFNRVDIIEGDAATQIANGITVASDAETDMNARLTDALKQTREFAQLADQLSATAKPIGHIAQQVDAALPDFLDCDVTDDGIGNPTCIYRRYADVTADFDHMVQAAATATPRIVQSADAMTAAWAGILEALQKWVDRLTAPPTVKDEIKAWIRVVIEGLSHAL